MASKQPARSIFLFMPSLRGGGAERAMLLFAQGLIQLGYEPTLILVDKQGGLIDNLPDKLKVIDLNKKRSIFALLPLAKILKREKPQALFSTMVHANIIALLAALLAGVDTKIVVREANVPLSGQRQTISKKAVFYLTPLVYKLASAIIAVSDGVADELKKMAPALANKIKVLPNPVVSPDILQQANEPLEDPWFNSKDIPVILAAARLQPHKGFINLLHAFAMARKSRNMRLVILGEGPERPALEQVVNALGLDDCVKMPGWVLNPFCYMQNASVFVLSSEYEGMPNVLLQAIAFGLPVVATDCPSGPREILTAVEYGELVPMRNVNALQVGILNALDTTAPARAKEYVRSHYGITEAAKNYLACIDIFPDHKNHKEAA